MERIVSLLEQHYPWITGVLATIGAPVAWILRLWWKDRIASHKRIQDLELATLELSRANDSRQNVCDLHANVLDEIKQNQRQQYDLLRDIHGRVSWIEGRVRREDEK